MSFVFDRKMPTLDFLEFLFPSTCFVETYLVTILWFSKSVNPFKLVELVTKRIL